MTLLEEHHDAFSLCDETGICPQIRVYLKLPNEVPFFVTYMW